MNRAECVDYLYRVLQQTGEALPPDGEWLQPKGDHDGDGKEDYQDALPFDRDNDSVPIACNRQAFIRVSFHLSTACYLLIVVGASSLPLQMMVGLNGAFQ